MRSPRPAARRIAALIGALIPLSVLAGPGAPPDPEPGPPSPWGTAEPGAAPTSDPAPGDVWRRQTEESAGPVWGPVPGGVEGTQEPNRARGDRPPRPRHVAAPPKDAEAPEPPRVQRPTRRAPDPKDWPPLAREPGPLLYPRAFDEPALAEDAHGHLWLTDEGRMYRYDPRVDGWQLADDGWRSQAATDRLIRVRGTTAFEVAVVPGAKDASPILKVRELELPVLDDDAIVPGRTRTGRAWQVASEAQILLPEGELSLRDAEVDDPASGEDAALWLVVNDRDDRGRLVRVPLVGPELGLSVGVRFPDPATSVAVVRRDREQPGAPLLVGTDRGLFTLEPARRWAAPHRIEQTAGRSISALSSGGRRMGEVYAGTTAGELVEVRPHAKGVSAQVVARWLAPPVPPAPTPEPGEGEAQAAPPVLGVPAIRVAEVDPSGLVWFGPGDSRGLQAWIPSTGQVQTVPLAGNGWWVEALFRDAAGRLWGIGVRADQPKRYVTRFPLDYRPVSDVVGGGAVEVVPVGGQVLVRKLGVPGPAGLLVCTGGWCRPAADEVLPPVLAASAEPLPPLDRWGQDLIAWGPASLALWRRGDRGWTVRTAPYPEGFVPSAPEVRPTPRDPLDQVWVAVDAGVQGTDLWALRRVEGGGVELSRAPRLHCPPNPTGACYIDPIADGRGGFRLVGWDGGGRRWLAPAPFEETGLRRWASRAGGGDGTSAYPAWHAAPAPLGELGAGAKVLLATTDGGVWFQVGDVVGRAGAALPGSTYARTGHGWRVVRAIEDALGQTWFRLRGPVGEVSWVLGPRMVAPSGLRLSAPLFSREPSLAVRTSVGHGSNSWEPRPAELLYRCGEGTRRASALEVRMEVGWRPASRCEVQTVALDGRVSDPVSAWTLHLSTPHLGGVVVAAGLGWVVALRSRRRERELEGQVVDLKWQLDDLEERIQVMDTRYVIGMPLRDDTMFFGRRHQIAELLLAVKNRAVVTVSGEKRIGKTSLLFKLKRLLETPDMRAQGLDMPVYLSMEQTADGSHYFRQLLTKIATDMALPPEDREEIGIDRIDSEIAARDVIVELFYLLQDRRRRRVLLLLDEGQRLFHDLGDEGTRIAQGLRHLASEYPDVFGLIIAGVDLTRYGSTQGPNSDLLGIGRILVLGPLDEADARELITKPSQADGVIYDPTSVDLMCLYTGCRPLRIQRLCSDIIAGWRRTCADGKLRPETPVPPSFVERYFQEQYGGQSGRLDAA